jgi:hypothetical protein
MPRWPRPTLSARQPKKCEVDVPLPTKPLMLAAGSRNSPAVTRSRLNILMRMSGRALHRETRTPGTPSVIMSPDTSSVDPDKAGRRHAPPSLLAANP